MTDPVTIRKMLVGQLHEIDRKLIELRINCVTKKSPKRQQLVLQRVRICSELNALKTSRIKTDKSERVSDHAVLRWLERQHGVNVTKLRERILTPTLLAAILAGEKYVSEGDIVYVISDGCVQTVIPVHELATN